jgi:hypothetical protein
MLRIRSKQFAAFSHAEVEKFEEWMEVHLKKFFPEQCDSEGEEQLREKIRYGIKRAAVYGITTKRDVCKYIDLSMVLGPNFDVDGQVAWAAEILRRPCGASQKIDELYGTLRARQSGLKTRF